MGVHDRFLQESPESTRRLALLLYALVTPPFTALVGLVSPPAHPVAPAATVFALCASGFLWMLARRSLSGRDWIVPAGIIPPLCCAIGYVTCGRIGIAFMGVIAAPLAWATVLFDGSVVIAALVTATLGCVVGAYLADGAAVAAGNAALFLTIQGLVAWVGHEKSSRFRRDRLSALERQLNDVSLVIRRRDGQIVDANDRAAEAYGYPLEALLRMNIRDLRPTREADLVTQQMRRVESTRSFVFEAEHLRRDGTRFPVEVSSRAFESSGESFLHSLVRDLSERRKAEGERQMLATLLHQMPEGVAAMDLDMNVRYLSPGAERMFKFRSDEVVGKPLFSLTRPGWETSLTPAFVARVVEAGTITEVSERRVRDGSSLVVSASFTALRERDGSPTGLLGVARDITAEHHAEDALRRSEARYRSVVTSLSEGLLLQTAEGHIVACNPSAEHILGLSSDQLLSATIADPGFRIFREDGMHLPLEEYPAVVTARTGAPCAEVILRVDRTVDGRQRWISVNTQALRDGDDAPPFAVVSTLTDVTDRRGHEEALAAALRENIRMVNELSEALHNVKTLRGLLPICAWCKRVRDDSGYWDQLEQYITHHTDTRLTHGICPECAARELGALELGGEVKK